MKENIIEETIKTIEKMIKSYKEADECGLSNNDFKNEIKALSNILSDYKRVLKENESLQKTYDDCYCKYKHYKQFESISVQKVKDKIEELKEKEQGIKENEWLLCSSINHMKIQVLQELLEKE